MWLFASQKTSAKKILFNTLSEPILSLKYFCLILPNISHLPSLICPALTSFVIFAFLNLSRLPAQLFPVSLFFSLSNRCCCSYPPLDSFASLSFNLVLHYCSGLINLCLDHLWMSSSASSLTCFCLKEHKLDLCCAFKLAAETGNCLFLPVYCYKNVSAHFAETILKT